MRGIPSVTEIAHSNNQEQVSFPATSLNPHQFQSSPKASLVVLVLAASEVLVFTLALGLGWRTAPRPSRPSSSSSKDTDTDTERLDVAIGVGEGLDGLEDGEGLGVVNDLVGVDLVDLGDGATGFDEVRRMVGLDRGRAVAPVGLVKDGAGGGASALSVVDHAVDTSDISVDARLVDPANFSVPLDLVTAFGGACTVDSIPLNPRAEPKIDSGSSVCAVSNGPHASGSSSSASTASFSFKSSAPPSDDAEDSESRVVLAELMPVEFEDEDEWGVCIR